MPQRKNRRTAEEILGIVAPQRRTAEEILGLALQPSPQLPPQPEVSTLENIRTGLEQGGQQLAGAALTGFEALGSAMIGDFTPAREIAELAGRGALSTVGFLTAGAPADPRIAQIQAEQQARQLASPLFRSVAETGRELEAEAARDPSFAGRATRFVAREGVRAAPVIAAGVATGGSLPAIAAATAATSLDQPENLALNVGLNVVPVPVGRVVAPIIRRIRGGRSAAQEAVTPPLSVRPIVETPPVSEGVQPAVAPSSGTGLANLGGIAQVMSENLRRTLRDSVARTGKLPSVERGSSIDRAFEAAVAGGAPRNVDTLDSVISSSGQFDALGQALPAPTIPRQPITAPERLLPAIPQRQIPPIGGFMPEGQFLPEGEFTEELFQSIPNIPQSPLDRAFVKLGTANVQEIGDIIQSANRRFVAKASPSTIRRAERDFDLLGQLAPDEQTALGQILPPRPFQPAARKIADIPLTEPQAQLEANLRNLEDFFSGVRSRVNPQMESIIRASEGLPPLNIEIAPPSFGVRAGAAGGSQGARASLVDEARFTANPSPVNTIPKQDRGTMLEIASTFIKSGLISPLSHLKNILGTTTWQISRELERIPSAILDILASPFTGRRMATGPNPMAVLRSMREGWVKGVDDAKEIIKNGITPEQAAQSGLDREIKTGSKILDTLFNLNFRALTIEDAFLRRFATRRALEDLARSQALTEARQGLISRGQVGQRTRELVSAPPEDMAATAAFEGEAAIFTNENTFSRLLGAGRQAIRGTTAGQVTNFAIDRVLAFPKTPSNIIAEVVRRLPGVPVATNAGQIAKAIITRSFTPEQQRKFVQAFGRNLGAGLVALGWKGYNDGWLTGTADDDPTRRARDEAARRTPGAIRIGDNWYQISGFPPLGSLLVIGATLARETNQEQAAGQAFLPALGASALEATGEVALEFPLMQSARDIFRAAQEPGTSGARFAGALAGQFVPFSSTAAQIAEAFDPLQRDTREAPLTGPILRRIPGLRQTLPPALDVTGQPRQDFSPGQAFFDPTRATSAQERTNPLLAELVRLDQGISRFEQNKGEKPEAFRNRVQAFGRLFSDFGIRLVISSEYAQATDTDRREALNIINSRAKTIITEGNERQAPLKLSPQVVFNAIRVKRLREQLEQSKQQ